MNIKQFVDWKIKNLESRRPNLCDEVSKYAMNMSIKELKEVRRFIIEQEKFVSSTKNGMEES